MTDATASFAGSVDMMAQVGDLFANAGGTMQYAGGTMQDAASAMYSAAVNFPRTMNVVVTVKQTPSEVGA
jgi:hypothetical protein